MEALAPIVERAKNGGEQKVYRFENGYGASVVRGPYTYGGENGLWELGVLLVTGEDEPKWSLTYDTPITDDVIGHLSWDEVEETLAQIAVLPKVGS
jgi:hypothetical protein